MSGTPISEYPEITRDMLELRSELNSAYLEITSLRAQLDEARRKAIDDAAQVADEYALKVRSLMRGVPSVEEGTAQSIAKLIRALLSESKT